MRFPYLFLLFAANVQLSVAENDSAVLGIFNLQGNPFESVPEMERRVKKWVNSGIKLVLPYMMNTITEIRLSPGCTRGFLKLMRGVMDLKDWAFRMLDALGKPPAGILEGTAAALGDYDECLAINVPNQKSRNDELTGKYCMLQINIPEALRQAAIDYQTGNRSTSVLANSKTFLRTIVKIAPRADIADFRLGVCLPSSCSADDLQAIVNEITKVIKIEARTLRCETKQPITFSTEQAIFLGVISVLLLVITSGTACEIILKLKSIEDFDAIMSGKKKSRMQFLLSFSAGHGVRRLLCLQDHEPVVGCARGMNFISICLYVVVATYANPQDFHFLKYRSAFHFYKFLEELWFTAFANASTGVDTLFFIAGLQVTYSMWKKNKAGENGKMKINSIKFLTKWYTRLALLQLLVIGVLMCLPLVGSGPIWADVVTPEIEKCRSRWWMNVLFISNFWPSADACMWQMWIVSDLMQLLLIVPILLYVLSRWSVYGMLMILLLMVTSSAAVAIVTMINDLPPAPAFYFLSFLNLRPIWDKIFIQSYAHVPSFCLGVFLGYFMAKTSKVKISKGTVLAGWIFAILCNLAVLCGLYGYRHGESMDTTLSVIYASVHRFAWSIGIAWISFACFYGYGGFVNSILSWKAFIPLDRISSLVYLLSLLVFYLHSGQIREKMYMAHIDQVMYSTAYIVFTIALAALCYVIFCSPFLALESKIWNSENCLHGIPFSGKADEKIAKITEKIRNGITKCDLVTVNTEVPTTSK